MTHWVCAKFRAIGASTKLKNRNFGKPSVRLLRKVTADYALRAALLIQILALKVKNSPNNCQRRFPSKCVCKSNIEMQELLYNIMS